MADVVQCFRVDDSCVRNNAGAANMILESVVKEFVSDQRKNKIRRVVAEEEFVPKGFGMTIKVRVYRYSGIGAMSYCFETSPYARTPLQTEPYIADPWERSAAAAANRAVEGILARLEEAKKKGYEPNDRWLIENALWE